MDRNKGHPMEKKLCGAKKKNGELCKNNRLCPNGRCKHHGGFAGPPKGNKNAVKTGAYESILFSSFSDEEKELIDNTSLDAMKQIDDELKIITVRQKRMLDRYAKVKQDDYTITTIEEIQTKNGNRLSSENKTIKENNDIFLHKMESELNKLQNMKLKLIAQKAHIESQRISEDKVDVSNIVDAITQTSKDVWGDEDEEE
jgi:uncharacterized protein YjcR